MIKKGDRTRTAILETAKELFSDKGYSAVTMKDFCERQGLSRGGLYRHFASTKEIFIAMLDSDRKDATFKLDQAISDKISAKQLLIHLLNTQKNEIQQDGGSLSIAIYEFCTNYEDQKSYMDSRFTSAVDTLEKLIQYGKSQHEFLDCDAKETARHIIIFFEGLKISSAVISFSNNMLEKQLKRIYEMVVKVDEQIEI